MATIVEQIIRPFLEKTPSKADIDAAEKLLEDAKRDQPTALVEQVYTLGPGPPQRHNSGNCLGDCYFRQKNAFVQTCVFTCAYFLTYPGQMM